MAMRLLVVRMMMDNVTSVRRKVVAIRGRLEISDGSAKVIAWWRLQGKFSGWMSRWPW